MSNLNITLTIIRPDSQEISASEADLLLSDVESAVNMMGYVVVNSNTNQGSTLVTRPYLPE